MMMQRPFLLRPFIGRLALDAPFGRRLIRAERRYSWRAFQKKISPNCWSRTVLIPPRWSSLEIWQTLRRPIEITAYHIGRSATGVDLEYPLSTQPFFHRA